MSERSDEDMAFLIWGVDVSTRSSQLLRWENVKLEERTTDYGSALFAFKYGLIGNVFSLSSLKVVSSSVSQILPPFVKRLYEFMW